MADAGDNQQVESETTVRIIALIKAIELFDYAYLKFELILKFVDHGGLRFEPRCSSAAEQECSSASFF